jgi:DNA-binding transcriptional LysR family regulator
VIDIDLRYLRSFLVVAEEASITRAASRMYTSQQALSRQIQSLERAFGVILLVRTSRGVLLTTAGEELAAGARTLTADVQALARRVRAAAREQSGTLRLACCPYATTMFAIEIAGIMETAVPGIEVEVISVLTPRDEMHRLIAGEADAAFMWLPAGDGLLNDAPLREDQRVVAVSETHELGGRSSVSIADLADDPVVIADLFFCEAELRYWIVDPRPDGRPALRGPVVSRMEEVLMQVKRGNGVWFAPQPLARWAGTMSGVRWIPVDDADSFQLSVVWTTDAPPDLVARLIAEARTASASI